MDKHVEQFTLAKRKVFLADYVVSTTYLVIKDPKILLAALKHLYEANEALMSTVLHFERSKKNIPPFHDSYSSKFNVYEQVLSKRSNILKKYLVYLQQIFDLDVFVKKAPVEFSRDNARIICSENYAIEKINAETIKTHVATAKKFIADVELYLKQDAPTKNQRITESDMYK